MPIGKDETGNIELSKKDIIIDNKKWLSHQEILERINGADLKRASK